MRNSRYYRTRPTVKRPKPLRDLIAEVPWKNQNEVWAIFNKVSLIHDRNSASREIATLFRWVVIYNIRIQIGSHSGVIEQRVSLRGNAGLKFLCQPTMLRVETSASVLTSRASVGTELSVPINHFEGNYTCDSETLAQLRDEDRIVLRYVDNPNGSVDDIAGVCSEGRNVVGLMPHPERACDELLGSADGAVLIGSLLDAA